MTEQPSCPVCRTRFDSYLALAKHMAAEAGPDIDHRQWLTYFLGKPPDNLEGKEEALANALRECWLTNRQWPSFLL